MTIGNSSRDPKPSDPGGLVFNKIAKDAICIVTNPANPLAEPVAGRRSRRSSPARSATGSDVPGAGVDRPDRPRRPHRGLGHAGRVPEDLHGLDVTCPRAPRAKASNGLVQQAVQSDKNAIGYVSLDFVKGIERRRLPGRRLQPAQRQVRRVRRRAQLLDGHPRPRHRARVAEVHQLGPELQQRPEDRRHALGAAASRCCDAAPSSRGPDRRAERMLGALACLVLRARSC